jgi:hypothetical protein
MSAAASSLATPETPAPRTRAEVNRANAQHSTGPRTADGKSRASMNALKHGLFAAEAVLPGEDCEAFKSLVHDYARGHNAETSEELAIAEGIVSARWRAHRLKARETALTALSTEQHRPAVEKLFQAQFEADHDAITPLAEAAGLQANARLFHQLWLAEARLYRRAELAEEKLTSLVHFRHVRALLDSESDIPDVTEEMDRPTRAPVPEAAAAPADSGFVPPLSPKPAFPPDMPHFTGPLQKEKRRQWLRKHGLNELAKAA